jgi:hypothetical protein
MRFEPYMRNVIICCFLLLLTLSGCTETGGGGLTVNESNTSSDPASGNDGTITAPTCQTDEQFMANQVWPRILSQCAACHNGGGLAGTSGYILQNDASAYQENWDLSRTYEQANSGQLLAKAMATVAHGGGRLITDGDSNHSTFTEFLQRFTNPITECENSDALPPSGTAIDARTLTTKLTLNSASQTLRQAALLLAGRLPTDSELNNVTEDNLKAAIRGLMTGDNFDQFLMEAANDQLLTMKWASSRTPGLSALNGENFYPQVNQRIQPLEDARDALVNSGTATDEQIQLANTAVWEAHQYTNRGLAEEPLRLITHVVKNERHYGEVLTANYIMVNPFTNDVFDAGAIFNDNNDPNEWQPGYISSGYRDRSSNLPHAGVLTSPMFLARYPSTETNRNRARSRWTYYFFLGVNIEGLAVRPMNGDSLMDVDNPTLNNPDCAVCHEIMDPVAGAFQNWGNDGQFRDQCGWYTDTNLWECDRDSLPWVGYKEYNFDNDPANDNDFQPGDLWYRDMRAPGFNNTTLPSGNKDSSLNWLANQIIADDRFAEGTVRFWFKGLYGREPIPLPSNTSDPNFNGLMAAHELDKLYIQEFATAFANGSAGTAEHGIYNLKDLLVDMIMSPLFRGANATEYFDASHQVALAESGLGRLLTPEQLNRKLVALLGRHWEHVWDPERNQLTQDFYGFYGGIDSDGITDRSYELNAIMATVTERFANEASCNIVVDEFELPNNQRILFPNVTPNDVPTTTAGEEAIRAGIEYLITRLWGSSSATTEEVEAAYNLFIALRNERIDNGATTSLYAVAESEATDDFDEYCTLDWSNTGLNSDANQVIRPWVGVMVYLLTDYKMLYL